MGLETATWIDELDPTNPTPTDPKSQGDDHLRLTKSVLQNQFPSLGQEAVTLTAAEINSGKSYDGSWTPRLTDSSNNEHSYSVRWGRYHRTGKLVTVWGNLILSAKNPASTGTQRIANLPFAASAEESGSYGMVFTKYANTDFGVNAGTYLTGSVTAGNNFFTIRKWYTGDNDNALNDGNLTDTTTLTFTGSYMTDEP